MTACICIEDWQGKIQISIYHDKKTIPQWLKLKIEEAHARLIDIQDIHAHLPMGDIKTLYLNKLQKQESDKPTPPPEPEKEKPLRMQKGEFLSILDKIIKTSNQEGEVSAAKEAYKRVAGMEWGL
jgi:hypothetical protein